VVSVKATWRATRCGHATVVGVRHAFWTVVRFALVVVVVAVVRAVLLDRAPQRALHGGEPVIGSLDTWPVVPRKPGT
jgi:hypothetical protein